MMKSIVAAVFLLGFTNAIPNGYFQQMRMQGVPFISMYQPEISAKLITSPECNPEESPVLSEGAMSFVYGAGDHISSEGFIGQTQQSGIVDNTEWHSVHEGVEKYEKDEKVTDIVPEVPEPFHTGYVEHAGEFTTCSNQESYEKDFQRKFPESASVIPVEIQSEGAESKVTESKAAESSIYKTNASEATESKDVNTAEASESTIYNNSHNRQQSTGDSRSTKVELYGSNTGYTESDDIAYSVSKGTGLVVLGVKGNGTTFESKIHESTESNTSETTLESKPVVTTIVKEKKVSIDVPEDSDEEVHKRYDGRRGGSYFPIYFGLSPGARSDGEASGGVVSIANSYSTGRGGVASSQATAYGNGHSASSV